jgi:hypothetical protein
MSAREAFTAFFVGQDDPMNLNHDLPDSVARALERQLPRSGKPRYALPSDLTLDRRYGESWLIVADGRPFDHAQGGPEDTRTGRMAGFTAGCPLHDGRTFHVLFEISDLAVKGAAQFLFRELCREARTFEWINAGSASGLDNLARVKESYRPSARLAAHTLAPPRR